MTFCYIVELHCVLCLWPERPRGWLWSIQERRPRTLPCQDETWKVLCWQDYERASLMSQRLLLRHLEFVLCLILRPSTLGKVKLLFVKIDGPCYNTLSLHGPLYCPDHTLVLILLPFFQILKLNLRIWSLSFSRIVRQQGIWLGMLLALRNSCLWCVIFERWLNFKMLIFIWYLVPCT